MLFILMTIVALVVGLYAAVMAKWKVCKLYSDCIKYPNHTTKQSTRTMWYGYGRVEILSGYVNAVFLVVVAMGFGNVVDLPHNINNPISVMYEAVIRLFQPPEINTV